MLGSLGARTSSRYQGGGHTLPAPGKRGRRIGSTPRRPLRAARCAISRALPKATPPSTITAALSTAALATAAVASTIAATLPATALATSG